MIDANTFREKLRSKNLEIESSIDEWLSIKVLPNFKGKAQGFKVPKQLVNINLLQRLIDRGFDVNDYSGYQGYFIYFHDNF